MKYLAISILFLICSLKAHGQGGETKWIKPSVFKFNVTEAVYIDAEEQNIKSDRIIISFTVDEKCQIHDFMVTQSKLKTFSEWAKKDKDNIIREWVKNNPCNGKEKRGLVKIPIQINF